MINISKEEVVNNMISFFNIGIGTPMLPRVANSSLDYSSSHNTRANGGMNTSFNITADRMNKSSYIVK